MKTRLAAFLILVATATPSLRAEAAACCASSGALPALITGDHAVQVGANVSETAAIADADVLGTVKQRAHAFSDQTQTVVLDFATLLSDRWQTGVSVPLVRHSVDVQGGAESTRFGDVRASGLGRSCPSGSTLRGNPGLFVRVAYLPSGRSVL